MRLLESEKVEVVGKEEERKLQERIDSLKREEIKAVADLNAAKERAIQGKKDIQNETDKFVAEQKARGQSAREEADAIESFRKDVLRTLLRPISEMEKEAQFRLELAEQREKDVARKIDALGVIRSDLKNKEDQLTEKERRILEMVGEIEAREHSLIERERHLRLFAETQNRRIKEEMSRVRQIFEKAQDIIKHKT